MKKVLFLAALAAFALSSCSKDKVGRVENELLAFSTYSPRIVHAKAAPGSVLSGSTLSGKFHVYGYNTLAADFDPSTNPAPGFLDGVVNYSGTAVSSSPERYWPKSGELNKLSFYGYYPEAGAGITPNVTAGLGSYAFTTQTSSEAQIDFMVSKVVANQIKNVTLGSSVAVNNTSGTVDLTFHHVLAQLVFKFKAKENYTAPFVIKGGTVKITSPKTVGTLTPNFVSGATTFTWSDVKTPAELTIKTSGNVTLGTTPAQLNADNKDVLLLIPQNIGTGAGAYELRFDYTDAQGLENKAIVKLDLNGITEWEINKKYVYTITLTADPILFSATCETFTAGTDGTFEIK